MTPQVPEIHYGARYDHKARWLNYWYQIRETLADAPASALEVGIGNGLVTAYLRRQGVAVTTVDIDAALGPDLVGSVTALPLPDGAVDVALCAEVLEHLPYAQVPTAVRELTRVARRRVVVSLPDKRHTLLGLSCKVPFFPGIEILLKVPTFRPHVFDGQHHWEIGKRGHSLAATRRLFAQDGWRLARDYVPLDCPTKHLFILEKA